MQKSDSQLWILSLVIFLTSLAVFPALAENFRLGTAPLSISEMSREYDTFGARISPDGKHIAAIRRISGQENPVVSVWSTDDLTRPPKQIGSQFMRIWRVSFLKNDRLAIYTKQLIGDYWFDSLLFSDLDGGNLLPILGGSPFHFIQPTIFDTLPLDPDNVLMDNFNRISKMNIRTGRELPYLRVADNEQFDWTDLHGVVRVKHSLTLSNGVYYNNFFLRNAAGNWQPLRGLQTVLNDRNHINIQFVSNDLKTIWVLTDKDANYAVLRKFDVDSQTFSDPIISNTEFDIVNVSFGSATDDHAQLNDAIREYCWQGPIIECQSNDPTDNRIRAFLETRFPGSNISMVLRNDGKSVLFTVSAPNRPPVFYFLKNETQLTRIGSIREDLGQKNLGAAFWISYAARDGLEITGILTLPYGYNMERDGRIPLVVMPHGGPWGGPDELDFDVSYWTQMFATRGFAVLQPNFRGTEGLGRTLWRAGDNEWGAKMSDDNDDGAKWLVELGIADPNRMMIYGYSYGGFAAAAAAARSGTVAPGLWQCAISGAPIINLARVANDWGESRFAKLVQGSTVTGWNPFDHLSEVRIPWLIVHGSKDVQADVVHSTDTATAMSRVNPMANFKLVLVDGMAHTLDNMLREHKTILMSEILDWTANHCGNISANFNDDEATLMVQERQSSAANRRPHRTKSQ